MTPETTETTTQTETPTYAHDCDRCTFLGVCVGERGHPFDLYHCVQLGGLPTVIGRYGSAGPDYTSGLHWPHPWAVEARRRAAARGLPVLPRLSDTPAAHALEASELEALVAEALEPRASLPTITAHAARLQEWGPDPRAWTWYSVSYLDSPLGFWQAQIGSDHGPPQRDHEPVTWQPVHGLSEELGRAWRALDRIRALPSEERAPFARVMATTWLWLLPEDEAARRICEAVVLAFTPRRAP